MSYTRFEDHTNVDGKVDWDGYRQAQKRNGEICSNCGKHLLFPRNCPENCSDCIALVHSKESISHSTLIRCPKCLSEWEALSLCDYHIHEDGEHEIICPNCDKEFIVKTIVSFKFESPAIEKTESKEKEQDSGS